MPGDTKKLSRAGTVRRTLPLIAGLVVNSRAASIFQTNAHTHRALSSSTLSDVCESERALCFADSTCVSCGSEYDSAIPSCTALLTSSSSCEDWQTALCCAVGDCTGNGPFADYADCINASNGGSCSITVGGCSLGTAGSGSDYGTTVDPTSDVSSTTTPTATSETECAAEVASCFADATCNVCASSYVNAAEGCAASLTTAYTCDEIEALACCAADGCEDNEIFSDYVACDFAEFNCGLISIDGCLADGSRAISGTDDPTTTTDPSSDVIPTTASSTSGLTSDSDLTTTDTGSDVVPTTSPSSSLTSVSDLTGSTGTTSDTDPCRGELDGCEEDATCMACVDAMNAAEEACKGSDYDSEVATCSEKLDIVCCRIADDLDCANTQLGAYIDCAAQADGCDVEIADCLVDSSGSSLEAGGDDSGSPLGGTDDDDGDDENEGNTVVDPLPVTDDGDEEEGDEDAEDTDAANTNGSSGTPSAFVGGGAVATAAALLLTSAATNNHDWYLFM